MQKNTRLSPNAGIFKFQFRIFYHSGSVYKIVAYFYIFSRIYTFIINKLTCTILLILQVIITRYLLIDDYVLLESEIIVTIFYLFFFYFL